MFQGKTMAQSAEFDTLCASQKKVYSPDLPDLPECLYRKIMEALVTHLPLRHRIMGLSGAAHTRPPPQRPIEAF